MNSFAIRVCTNLAHGNMTFLMGNSKIPNSNNLYLYNEEDTAEVISALSEVIAGKLLSHEWGVELLDINSHKDYSELYNHIENKHLGIVPTSELLGLMKDWKIFLMKWSDQIRKKLIVAWAIEKFWSKASPRAGQHILTNVEENTTIYLVVSKEDLKLTKEQFAQNILSLK